MDALEKLGWVRSETEKNILFKKSIYNPFTFGKNITSIRVSKSENEVSIYGCLTKQELLALAEVVKEME